VEAEANERAAQMRQTLLSATPDRPESLFDLVFANPPEALLREKAEFAATLEPVGENGGAQ
jgi:hypothetical protein